MPNIESKIKENRYFWAGVDIGSLYYVVNIKASCCFYYLLRYYNKAYLVLDTYNIGLFRCVIMEQFILFKKSQHSNQPQLYSIGKSIRRRDYNREPGNSPKWRGFIIGVIFHTGVNNLACT